MQSINSPLLILRSKRFKIILSLVRVALVVALLNLNNLANTSFFTRDLVIIIIDSFNIASIDTSYNSFIERVTLEIILEINVSIRII